MSIPQLATLFHQYAALSMGPAQRLRAGLRKKRVLTTWTVGPLLAHPDARWLVARLACAAFAISQSTRVGGLEIGAIPLATSISDYAHATQPRKTYRTFVVRKQVKDHGLAKRIEGAVKADDRVLIVDDVLTSGGSILQALRGCRPSTPPRLPCPCDRGPARTGRQTERRSLWGVTDESVNLERSESHPTWDPRHPQSITGKRLLSRSEIAKTPFLRSALRLRQESGNVPDAPG